MRQKILILVLILGALAATAGVFLFLLFGGSPKEPEQGDELAQEEPRQIPSLTLQDYEGASVALEDLFGTPLVLHSWATWSIVSPDQLPALAALQEEYGEVVLFVAVNRAESLAESKAFTDSLNLEGRLLFLLDPGDAFYRAMGGKQMPETIFVDAAGTVRHQRQGEMNLEELRQLIQSIR